MSPSQGAVKAVRAGDLLVLPTDTVYGLGCSPFNPSAVAKLLATKGRDHRMPPPVLGATPEAVFSLVEFQSEEQRRIAFALADQFWPGPLTLILPAAPGLAWDTSAVAGTVAVRVPDEKVALELLEATGPLAVTSANPTGEAPARTLAQAKEYFGAAVAVHVDGGDSGEGRPSTILDLTATPSPRCVRVGDVSEKQLSRVVETLLDREMRLGSA